MESSKELVGQQLYPPLPRSGPQRKPQQCVLVVDRGLFEFQGASTGVWLDNVFIALRRGSSSTAGRSMQVTGSFMCPVVSCMCPAVSTTAVAAGNPGEVLGTVIELV